LNYHSNCQKVVLSGREGSTAFARLFAIAQSDSMSD